MTMAGFFVSQKILASLDPKMSSVLTPMGDLELQRQELQKTIEATRKEIQTKTRIYHSLKSGASSPLYAWETEAKIEKKRKDFIPFLKIEIREKLKKLEILENQLEEVQYDLELTRATPNLEVVATNSVLPPTMDKPFFCETIPAEPLSQQLTISQGFGSHIDTESGLKWKSSGWWVTHMTGPIKSCAQGVVAFDDTVAGRGRVVMIDHGNSILTLYANLNEGGSSFEESTISPLGKKFKKGDRIEAGALIGTAKEKFYFELRKSGVPMDPKLALSSEQVSKVKLAF